MKKIILLLLTTILLFSCGNNQKIGFVNSEELMTNYKATKNLEAEMKILDQQIQKELPALVQAFQAKVAVFQKKAKKMTQAQRMEKGQKLGREEQVLKQRQNQVQTQGRAKMTKIAEIANDFIKEYGKKNGYKMIFGTVNINGAVMYGDDAANLTDTVLKALNAKFDEDNNTTTPVKKEESKTEETKKETPKKEEAKK